MNIEKFQRVYLIGIGGIGMSAIARFFSQLGKKVAGYDRTPTVLTRKLEEEGMDIHYEINLNMIKDEFKEKETTLIVYTPAVPQSHHELYYFKKEKFNVFKRSQILGHIVNQKKCIAVAGTHGKTSISTMIAHILKQSKVGCNAFLGGISKNYNTNFLYEPESEYVVVEADEYDRSFLELKPYFAIVTSVDADHLDIYGNKDELRKTYIEFIHNIRHDGLLLLRRGADDKLEFDSPNSNFLYSLSREVDFHAENLQKENNLYKFDLITPQERIDSLICGLPGLINVKNAIAAASAAYLVGVNGDEIRKALWSFKGIKRRFDYQIDTPELVYIDDYAHHPAELEAAILSVRKLYPERKITGIFQPHLYSRTKNFAKEFAANLDLLNDVILLDIYPAREEPIPGVSSELIFNEIKKKKKVLCKKNEVVNVLKDKDIDVLLTLGAGDIDQLVTPIKNELQKRLKAE